MWREGLAVLAGGAVVALAPIPALSTPTRSITTEAICREARELHSVPDIIAMDLGRPDWSHYHRRVQEIATREGLDERQREEVRVGCGLYLQGREDQLEVSAEASSLADRATAAYARRLNARR